MLKENIDAILVTPPKNFESFLAALEEKGYEIKAGKNPAVRGNGQTRYIRFRSLGKGYTEEDIKKRIARELEFDPEEERGNWRKGKQPRRADRDFDLLIDINRKMQEGKGKYYERWAKIYNVKQMSKALLFLQEHNVRDYDALSEKARTSAERFHEVSDAIKEKEARLKNIADLKTQIIHYLKPREVYKAYRETGYSKKFLEAHREETLLHKAAKEAFDKRGLKKLPKVKDLSVEYGAILAEKRKLYKEYRSVKQDMMNYQIAKQDIDRFLKIDEEQRRQQEKEPKSKNR